MQKYQFKQIFVGLVDLCWKHRINIPTYTELNEIITGCFNETKSSILTELEALLTDQQCQQLETLLSPGMKIGPLSQPGITELKKINQGLRPGEIQENIKTLSVIKEHFLEYEATFQSLPLGEQATGYYATWFAKADYQQLSLFQNRYKVYLHLLSFIKHQFYFINNFTKA